MKKLFTLLMVLAVATVGFAQNRAMMTSKKDLGKVAKQHVALRNDGASTMEYVSIQPNMMREYSDQELDYTTYDWQSNDGPRTWTVKWEDGKVNFGYTMATTTNYSDRGTGIGTYDYNTNEWIPLGGRIEDERTGFGSIARYGANGLVIAAHGGSDCGIFIVEDKDNMEPYSAIAMEKLDPTHDPCWPNVMTSGPNRDIIHIIVTASTPDFDPDDPMADVESPMIYFRSKDGGETWDKENEILPYMGAEYSENWNSNCCYWMETTEDNCLALVVNNSWSDGMVLYSYDDGDTWERKVFYKHPGPHDNFDSTWYAYPRWTSCQWDSYKNLHIAYEWMFTTGEPGSGSYYPSLGGVSYWSEILPYHGCDTVTTTDHVVGEPFVMDSAYTYNDIYASQWHFSDRSHAMWPEFIGPLVPLTDDGDPEDPEELLHNPCISEEDTIYFNISDRSAHGSYNCGICSFPVLCMVPGSDDMVAVWSMMDENNQDASTENFPFKLYARYSPDGGLTWSKMKALTKDVELRRYEMVYNQAVVIDHNLIIATMCDATPGTYVMSADDNPEDNYYQGLFFNLDDLFGEMGVSVPEVKQVTKMTICPNPAIDHLDVTLNTNSDIMIYNIMGQLVSSQKGYAGLNTLDVSSLSSGVYFINADSDTQKFVVK